MGNYDVTFDSDESYVHNLEGRTYMAGVSPWFFTVSSSILLLLGLTFNILYSTTVLILITKILFTAGTTGCLRDAGSCSSKTAH